MRSKKVSFLSSFYRLNKTVGILFLIFFSSPSFSQVSTTYTFSKTTATHAFMAGGTTLASGNGASMDDAIYTNVPIGFTFNFNGVDYTTCGVSTNGFAWFGTTNPAVNDYTPISSATGMSGVISPYGANLTGRVAAAFIKYTTTGTCPNRVFMIEWNNMIVSGIATGSFSANRLDLQIKLYEGTNKIDINAYDSPYLVSTIYNGQVGLRGNSNSDYNNRSVSCASGWNASIAGASNTVVCLINGSTCSCYPAANLVYTFTNVSSVSSLTWNGSASTDWFTAANWTPAVVPTSYYNVTIPAGMPNYPVLTGSANAFCRNLTLAAVTSLTTNAGYSGTLLISGSIASDGTISNSGVNYIYITGTVSGVISGVGDYTAADLFLSGACANYTINNTIVIRKVNIGVGATLNMNTFNLTVLSSFIQTGTINQSTGVLQIEDPAATLTNATFNENTGTTYFAIGTSTTAGNQLIPSITYYNLTVNTNNGFTATIGNGSTVTCNNLKINNPSTAGGIASVANIVTVNANFDLAPTGNTPVVNLSSNITVTGVMTLYLGVINTGANKVVMNNSTSTAIAAGTGNTNYTLSYINGNLRRPIASGVTANYDFPLGDATTSRYTILIDSALSGGGFTLLDGYFGALANHTDASMIATEPTEAGVSYVHMATEGVWFLDPDNQPASGKYSIQTFINSFAGLTDDQFAILKRISTSITGADWYNGGPTATRPASMQPGRTTGSGYALRHGLTSFSQFGIATQTTIVLPIELLSFTGKSQGNENMLYWTTATETNNDYFTVERAPDASHFAEMAIVDGAGNSTQVLHYSTPDKTPFSGISYYRLKQTDFNGRYAYSNIVPIATGQTDFEIVNTYSSTEQDGLEVTMNCEGDCMITIELYDMQGKKVYSSLVNATGNHTKAIIPTTGLSQSIYLIKAFNGSKLISKKVKL